MSSSRWVDLQVNGYAGVDFNSDQLTLEQALAACQQLDRDGVDGILPTVITAPLPKMLQRIEKLTGWIETVPEIADRFWGLHIEGPFINRNSGFVGAHPPASVLPATPAVAEQLLVAGRGQVKLLTLAPECDERLATTAFLAKQGVVVAAGHSDASRDQLAAACDAGLRMYTHLGNGCPGLMHRHDNIVQRVLSLADRLVISFIADSHHVPTFALRNYLSLVPDENIVIVTDAISAAGLGPGEFQLSDQTVFVDEHGAAWSADRTHFAGSAATFPVMQRVLLDMGYSQTDIDRWMGTHPRRVLSLG